MIPMRSLLSLLIAFSAWAQGPMRPDVNGVRPIPAKDTIWIEEMTWMEVRDALKSGKKYVIVPTGGVEQNGPYLAAGKHNYVLRATAEAIARKMGNTLIAPIVPFVPEGDIQPPSGHMLYPSTISLREETFQALLTDIAESLHVHGFTEIFLIGDSGGNVKGMAAVAQKLSQKWGRGIHHIPEHYDYARVFQWLESQGVKEPKKEGIHDDYVITSIMMTVDPTTVRAAERQKAGKFSINGLPLAPVEKTVAMGKRIVEFRAESTVAAMRKALAK